MGDSQGVERLFGDLSAHMWPGLILKTWDVTEDQWVPANPVSDAGPSVPRYNHKREREATNCNREGLQEPALISE